jgi:hypothetical protein
MLGRIDSSEFYNGNHYISLSTPAEDAYSKPSTFKIQSEKALGGIGEEIQVEIKISGYVKEKTYTDKNTGEIKKFSEPHVFFTVANSLKKAA